MTRKLTAVILNILNLHKTNLNLRNKLQISRFTETQHLKSDDKNKQN